MRGPCARRPGAPIAAPPTLRQLEVLSGIQAFNQVHGFAPSIRDLCEVLGIRSTNGVEDHLDLLERRGLITRNVKVARSLRLTAKGQLELDLPAEREGRAP